MNNLTIEERIALIKSIAENGGEIIGADQLKKILESNEPLFTYDGFEPSGQMHIAQGIIRAINTNKMIDAGFTFKMWVADWFGYLNNKMGGDLEKIKVVGQYFIEIWKASGMNLDKTEFLWTSDFVSQRWYWELVMKVAKSVTLKRALRTTEIMGRSENDELSAAQILYPCMQIADIFGVMKCQVTQLGLDQRKVNIVAREIGEDIGFWKPVIVSHGMLQGLQKPLDKKRVVIQLQNGSESILYSASKANIVLKNLADDHVEIEFVAKNGDDKRNVVLHKGEKAKFFDMDVSFLVDGVLEVLESTPERLISMKMSKSKPDTAIFMTDSADEVKSKIMKAYCPEGIIEDNPILDYCKQIIFQANYLKRKTPLLVNGKFLVEREDRFGGDVEYSNFEELEAAFKNKELFALDLKSAVIKYLNELLQPVRHHFENDANAKSILEQVKSFQVTR